MRPTRGSISRVLFVLLVPSVAFAHPMKGVGDFYAGMLHPIMTVETILPLVALSLLAGQQQRETAIKILAAFPASIALGTLLIFVSPVPGRALTLELVITALTGILIALARMLPSIVPIGVGVVLGLSIGWANASEITKDVSAARFVAGLVVAGLLMTAYGIGVVRRLKPGWTQIAVRVAGSWMAAIGMLVLGLK